MTDAETTHPGPARLRLPRRGLLPRDGAPRRAATKELDRVDFDPKLRELVRIRASQINGCAYCIDMHTKDARAIGETEQRIYALPAWARRPTSRARERAALGLTESVTLLARDHVRLEATTPSPRSSAPTRSAPWSR